MLHVSSAARPASTPRIAETLPVELKYTARLGVPLAIGELGWMSTYIVDALMIGRLPHSALSISASSLGNTIFYAMAFCAIGLSTGLESLVAQAFGRGEKTGALQMLAQSMWLVVISTPLVMGGALASVFLLKYCGTPAEIIAETRRYLDALVWSTGPLLLYWTLRRYLQSIDRVLLIMFSLVTASVVNLLGDWVFLYGRLGFRPLGIAGSGWATCVVRLYTLIPLLIALYGSSAHLGVPLKWRAFRPDPSLLRPLLRIGWPAALQSLADLGVSTFMSIVCATLGATLLAAHQVVLDLNAFVYMVPLGLSYATITRVGQSAGRKNLAQMRRSAKASLVLGLSFIAAAASLFVAFPGFWAGLYTNDAHAVKAAIPIFAFCGVLQVGDAVGVITAAALVGLGDTRTPLITNTVWSWLIGMPMAYWLTVHAGMGLRGLWTGRVVSAIGAALTLWVAWTIRTGNKDQKSVHPATKRFGIGNAGFEGIE